MKPIIIANWKCNPATEKEAKELFSAVAKEAKKIKNTEIVICAPFAWLAVVRPLADGGGLAMGAQNCFWEQKGAFTGEVSAKMLKDLECKYIIAGHSERRKYFGETNEIVNKKLRSILDAGTSAIFCVGETKEEREQGKIEAVVKSQIAGGLAGVSASKIEKVVVAYEPIWAIGTGNACSVEEAQKMRLFVQKIISELYSQSIAKNIKIIYGGSVNSSNSKGYLGEAGFGGLLVGGASLNAEEFAKIIKSA